MASSGSVMSASKTLFKHEEHHLVHLSLINTSPAALRAGEEVNIKAATNLSVEKRDAGADFPIGIVTVGGAVGERVTVATCLQRTVQAIAKGGTINAGALVKPNGVWNVAGLPEYVAAVATDFISAVVLSGGVVDSEITIGILRAPFKN
jgi:hypothetical protein